MVSTRGLPKVISQDNALNFVTADKQIKQLYKRIDWNQVEKYCLNLPEPIKFEFGPPLAAH